MWYVWVTWTITWVEWSHKDCLSTLQPPWRWGVHFIRCHIPDIYCQIVHILNIHPLHKYKVKACIRIDSSLWIPSVSRPMTALHFPGRANRVSPSSMSSGYRLFLGTLCCLLKRRQRGARSWTVNSFLTALCGPLSISCTQFPPLVSVVMWPELIGEQWRIARMIAPLVAISEGICHWPPNAGVATKISVL